MTSSTPAFVSLIATELAPPAPLAEPDLVLPAAGLVTLAGESCWAATWSKAAWCSCSFCSD
eukprot:CAMPEP_0170634784 /NCGR_PEP_ID=MMETSP0224-20130122/36826_1 /TAXON_ID=285029 /ORGANISM="Togula jolla, Strain CCCM 725" /LENGTH=60 /DNA_ID=CAMNT_0010964147 /DNA_START=96 /DNA_END=275 /DNA_ORIENTATION=-